MSQSYQSVSGRDNGIALAMKKMHQILK
ncbi:hypothetical protein [Methylophaga sp.]